MTGEETLDDLGQIVSVLDMSYLTDKEYCDHCLGRIFAKLGKGLPNELRGRSLRDLLDKGQIPVDACNLCGGICGRFDLYADLAKSKLKEWEFSNFLVGSKFDPEIEEKEEMLWSQTSGEHVEPIKAEFNREVGKLLFEKTGKDVEFERPDIVAVIDTTYDSIDFQVAPLYLYGRYRKLVRGIPQTRWPCRECRGKGCQRCKGTGKMYQTSVEEVIGREVMKHSGGKDHRFHGMGREDVDALMLGKGRPFVLEIKEPVRRNLPMDIIAESVNSAENSVEVNSLRHSSGSEVIEIKNARPEKKYRVLLDFEGIISKEKLKEVVQSLGGVTIAQQTPARVKHRRADKARSRLVRSIELTGFDGSRAEIDITAEAGTYVKELIHGDEGRTVPSLAGKLGAGCNVKELDVLEIMDEGM